MKRLYGAYDMGGKNNAAVDRANVGPRQTDAFAPGDQGDRHGVQTRQVRHDSSSHSRAQGTGSEFKDNGDGTITDIMTGLIWLKKTDLWSVDWHTAVQNVSVLADGTYDLHDGSIAGEWRLPTIDELQSLVNRSRSLLSLHLPSCYPFTESRADGYWSSTPHAKSSEHAWYVFLSFGNVGINFMAKNSCCPVWPVRAGNSR